jgi:uncharacterized membrane protein YbaN (DUF454 family)
MSARLAWKTMRKAVLAVLGSLSVAMAVVGIFVPGLPTTVFVLAAYYLFARSSPTLDRWLQSNRFFGPRVRRLAETRGMSARSKGAALVSMWLGVSLSWFTVSAAGPLAQITVAALGATGTATLLFAVRTVSAPCASCPAAAHAAGAGR